MQKGLFLSGSLVLIILLFFVSCTGGGENRIPDNVITKKGRSDILFDDNWRFLRGDSINAELTDYDDSAWRIINLPHDWSIEDIPGTNSPLDSGAIGGIDAGYFIGGTGWYRKEFIAPSDPGSKRFLIRFDGVYMNADIWLNGKHIGFHPYGYTSFRYDITDDLIPGNKNVLAVKVRNEGRNSRWYSGSGIYRHVWFTVLNPVHLDPWKLAVTTPEIDTGKAKISVKTAIFNETPDTSDLILTTLILDSENRIMATTSDTIQKVIGKSKIEPVEMLEINNPVLWSDKSPVMYRSVSELYTLSNDGIQYLSDRITTPFGIRKIEINAVTGFILNDEPLLLKGGCMHHDNGPLGAAAYDRAEERRVELMKKSGFNAIRCAHNPPSPAFLDACDRLGMLVIDEAFDMWREQKNPEDYHLYFDDWWQEDVESMVYRDRNHPSVVLWSIGNEIPESGKPEGAELAEKIAGYVKNLDPSRMITSAVNNIGLNKDLYFNAMDVCGYNYAVGSYMPDHSRLPERIIVSTESFPLEAWDYWMAAKDYPWVIGDFVWTGFDYLGEASIGWLGYPHEGSFYPWSHAFCGDIDICGFKRPQSYYRDILWENGKQVSIFVEPPVPSFPLNPHKAIWSKWEWEDRVASWNWTGFEDKKLKVEVYSSCQEVELFLNQQSLGRKPVNRENRWIAGWEVPYKQGELTAKGYEDTTEIASSILRTAYEPKKIRLISDRTSINADGQDLCFVTVELIDSLGVRNPEASNLIQFEVEGPGSIIATGSSNPMSTESFQQPKRKAYHGRCLVIIKAGRKERKIKLRASSEELEPAEIIINTHPGGKKSL